MDRYIWPLRKEPMSPDAVAGPHGQFYKKAVSYYAPEKYKLELLGAGMVRQEELVTVDGEVSTAGLFFVWPRNDSSNVVIRIE